MLNKIKRWTGKVTGTAKEKVLSSLRNEDGATIIEVIGYALIAVLAIVLVWGLISGWLPGFFRSITGRLENLS